MKKITILIMLLLGFNTIAQITTSSINGTVKTETGEELPGATVIVVHTPSGTKYYATTNEIGGFGIPAIRPGGPYTVRVSFVGFKTFEMNDLRAALGAGVTLNVVLTEEASLLSEVVITGTKNPVFSKQRTGASQQFSNREVNAVPVTGSRSINSITKYNANGNGSSFGGQDSRLNNFTIDGSVFNNGFGLGSDTQAGGRTGSTAISLDAIEELQVNIAPFDVRQSGFVGSEINAVTRSGTNEIEGSVYHSFRNNKKAFVGRNAGDVEITPSKFDEKIYGARIGAPIIKDKLFFFGNFEKVDNISPATTWTSTGSPNAGAEISKPTYQQMQDLSNFMQDKFGYVTGPWENYDSNTASKKFLTKLDWNINDNHKASIRYVHHDSESDQLISNSSSAGVGNRRTNANSMSYKNSGYTIMDNTRSIVLELNSKFSEKLHNNFIFGYDKQIEDRGLQGSMFPTIDIRDGGANAANFISLGLDPFTPGNKLDYNTLHFTNNLTKYLDKHTLVFGVNFEKFKSNNLFFPASNGVFIFNSLTDFYNAANESANNNFAPSTTNLPARLQFRYSALPGAVDPLQITKSTKIDLYAQDSWKVNDDFKITYGVRVSSVSFEDTALENPAINGLTFIDNKKFNTKDMPETQTLFEPRFGFNWDVNGKGNTQVRGGTGIFTGRPPYVFISNAVGNNGVLTGFVDVSGTNLANGGYGFTPNPNDYFIPAVPTLPTTFDLALTDKNFKFPQVWKTNIAVDQKLIYGFVGTAEFIYSSNTNAINYYNANLEAPVGTFAGSDNRPRYARNDNGVRINDNVSNAIVLENTDKGYYKSATFKLEYPYKNGFWGSLAYTVSEAKDLMSAGSIASGSWTGARSVNGNNDLSLSKSDNDIPNRIVGIFGYKIEYGKGLAKAATSVNLGYIGEQSRRFSYTYGGDMNGDRINNNDLIYVPLSASEISFQSQTITNNGVATVYTPADQQAAYEAFIKQDSYLSSKRGQYVERNGHILPMLHRIDLSVTQDFTMNISGKRNNFQFRADILNFTNFLNKDWGISQRAVSPTILNYRTTGADNIPVFQMNSYVNEAGTRVLADKTFIKNASVFDVWQAQFTLRYTFGN
ncbi:MAG: carboxypeptidase regulatory-like domain-containing protein [Lutibacter sp.]|nr:carboxypeptidase regulatory-like domain-containing protein [Lutibacter sp.]MDP3944901.1 carboxypeptidase regulatory-like domain-containing protein [Lutibacter sp.]